MLNKERSSQKSVQDEILFNQYFEALKSNIYLLPRREYTWLRFNVDQGSSVERKQQNIRIKVTDRNDHLKYRVIMTGTPERRGLQPIVLYSE